MKLSMLCLAQIIVLYCLTTTIVFAAPESKVSIPPPNFGEKPLAMRSFPANPVEKVSAGVYRIGEVTLNKKERTITFPAQINLQGGLLEYLVVRKGGKTHESLLRTTVEPYHLQLACLLIGLEGTDKPLAFQGAPEQPRGEGVIISLFLVNNDDKILLVKPEQWVEKRINNDTLKIENFVWTFTGSVVIDGRFMAQTDGSIIALYHDPAALIDNASPGGESDKIWFVNEKTVPPVGTPVTVTIKPRK